ncbi:Sperm-associated antigen, putative [Pediculus humanus corporis]|uniref:Sperm-associated antigen, putative n=1 Tax=Pediculus humanus subsp. corporis TaxID=121224 RepID=E0VIY8_PEDHC|nr:Sperm-associated antigen, putative [Pediculus humanus corporis]EEB13344.1 Sperm-associated antigen, putative [Pediculus humanus corporis]
MARVIVQLFEQYQKARTHFVQGVAELANRPANIECLHTTGVLELLKPLLTDMVPSVRLGAAVALGRMANGDEKVAEIILRNDILLHMLQGLENQNKHYKKAALFIVRSVAKYKPEMADIVIQAGGLDAALVCLEDFDQSVKEAAVWVIGYIARHSASHAQVVVDIGAVPLLVLCMQEPDLCLKQVSASAFSDIAKHSGRLATSVVDAGAIPYLAKALLNVDVKLKKLVLNTFANIAKHSTDLAELVVEAEIFPDAMIHLCHTDDEIKKAAAVLIREITKHTLELAQLIVNTGGIAALLEEITNTKNLIRLPAIVAIGYICAHNDQLALAVINAKGLLILSEVLCTETESHILAAVVWAVGQCGKHTPEHANAVAGCGLFYRILQLYNCAKSSQDLKQKCKCALKQVLQKTLDITSLELLLEDAPGNILKYVLGQFSKILPNNPGARRSFVASGALKKIQEIQAEPGSTLMEYITIINCCFPEEVVLYFSPGYPDSLLERVEQYHPQIPPILVGSRQTSEEEIQDNLTGEEEAQPCVTMI